MVYVFFCFFLIVKCVMKDIYSCFVKKGKCRRECYNFEKLVGFCIKLNVICCM